ncbi:MAG: hypothetical protein N4J56_007013 [Chroococcidiopsis sp. SAG 2025]|nr:hypothetical protein [Chroococcidiopsis sp. SAG 2025]
MRVQYGEHFCPNVISWKTAPRGGFEKLTDVNHTPLLVVNGQDRSQIRDWEVIPLLLLASERILKPIHSKSFSF